MEWSEIAKDVGKFAPLLGGVIGGPGGAALGGLVSAALGVANTPDAVSQALTTNPDVAVKLAQIESDQKVALQGMVVDQAKAQIAAEVSATVSVNTTMQGEAASTHWPTYSWRPAIGFSVAFAIALSVVTVFVTYGAATFWERTEGLQYLPGTLGAIVGIIGVASPILGIASWFRGKAQADPCVNTDNKG